MSLRGRRLVPVFLVAWLLPLAARAQTDVVTTSGTVHGAVVGPVIQWLGVPYAEPPVGSPRWRRPVARLPSSTVIDATVAKAACIQNVPQFNAGECRDTPGQPVGTLVGSEDCLTLSIWRPAAASATPRPVMVWIHGGAFVNGCAKDGLTNGADLALHGASGGQVVVAIQYRLGAMGFFALDELADEDPAGSAGNYGMLDMVLALEWVQDNVAAFGGDPANVTIFGESAGGVATCALLASPLTEGLFQRAIAQSGNCAQAVPLRAGANSGLPASATAIGRGEALSANAALACGDPATRLACMRAKTPAEIQPVYNAQAAGALGFPPTNMSIDDHFITEQPQVMLNEGAAGTRGLLAGSNANEMTVFTLTLSIPDAAAYEARVRAQAGDYVADYLLEIWPASEFPSPLAAYRRFAEDIGFVCPTFGAAKAVSDGGAPAHAYHYAYDPGGPLQLGAFHGLELFHLFGQLARLASLGIAPDAGDAALSDALQEAWSSYARTGSPNASPAWPPFAPAPSSPPANGSVYVWNVSPANALSSSVALAGALRDGRCAELADLAPLLNADADGRTNDVDNCAYAANSDQADASADGIGDACQCGDTADDGDVDAADLATLRLALAGAAPLGAAGESKCSVAGGSAECDVLDSVVLARSLFGLAPMIAQSCAAANSAS
jgi:para-nitrobenzyl esterase